MVIVQILKDAIKNILADMGAVDASFVVEHPAELSHGDYATNAALSVSKKLGKNPREVAEEVKRGLEAADLADVASVEIAGPGFINIKLSEKFFASSIPNIVAGGDDFGRTSVHAGKVILVEHSSPNLFKPFHIGHMMNNAIGESLARLMQFSGATVFRMSFPSDISLGIAKAIFIILEKSPSGELFKPSIEILGNAYVEGVQRYESDPSIHDRIKEISNNLYAGYDSPEWKAYNACKDFNVKYFKEIVASLGSTFDDLIYESEAGVVGKKIVVEHTPKVFTESEGAIVYVPDESKKNLNTAVFINSQGNPTYEAKDIGLLDLKFSRFSPDLSIFVTDYQQIPHFDIVLDAAEKINAAWKERSVHTPHGRMSFKGQKMSSRLGGVPLVTDIIDTVSEEVRAKSEGREGSVDPSLIAVAAIKFAILRAKPGQNINFDPETSLSFEGDSGPYLQYTHARIEALLEKGKAAGMAPSYAQGQPVADIERIIYRLPEVVEHAINEYGPQYVVTYLLEVAREFNSYYGANKIVDTEDVKTSAHRLAIARATQIVLKNGLWLLGIEAPNRM